MPTIITHGITGLAGIKSLKNKKKHPVFWIASILCPVLPDFDAVSFKLGIRYGDFFGHRGFSHSIIFAVMIAACAAFIMNRTIKINKKSTWFYVIYFFILTISHSLLDAMTDGGLGVAFFSPFDNTRYFFPFHPIKVAPISIFRFMSFSGSTVLLSEFIWVWLPAFTVVIFLRRFKSRPEHID